MKRIVSIVLMITMIMASSQKTYGSEVVHIRINDVVTDLGHNIMVIDNQTYIPVMEGASVLGARIVRANEAGNQVMMILGGHQYIFVENSSVYFVDGISQIGSYSILTHQETLYMPLRALASMLSFEIAWVDQYRTIELTKEGYEMPASAVSNVQYTYEEITWLARIVNFEGFDIGYEAKLAVANVVLNRVKVGHFPNGIYDVIYDTNYSVQFPPAHREKFKTWEPNEESYLAAMDALGGINNIDICLYFNNEPFTRHTLYAIIDGEYFYTEGK